GRRLLLGDDDRAAFVRALLGTFYLYPALALTAVLTRAAVVSAGARAVAFALVDSGALHLFAGRLGRLAFTGVGGPRGKHRANRGSHQRTGNSILHFILLWVVEPVWVDFCYLLLCCVLLGRAKRVSSISPSSATTFANDWTRANHPSVYA